MYCCSQHGAGLMTVSLALRRLTRPWVGHHTTHQLVASPLTINQTVDKRLICNDHRSISCNNYVPSPERKKEGGISLFHSHTHTHTREQTACTTRRHIIRRIPRPRC